MPMTNATPSLRQFGATPEKSSLCHLIVSLDPTAMGVLIRMQTPEGDVSSILAGARCDVPDWSCQQTSAIAIIAVLDSLAWTDWFTTSITSTEKDRALGTVGASTCDRRFPLGERRNRGLKGLKVKGSRVLGARRPAFAFAGFGMRSDSLLLLRESLGLGSGAGKRRFGRLQVEQPLQCGSHLFLLHLLWKFLEFTGQGPCDLLRHPGHYCG